MLVRPFDLKFIFRSPTHTYLTAKSNNDIYLVDIASESWKRALVSNLTMLIKVQ